MTARRAPAYLAGNRQLCSSSSGGKRADLGGQYFRSSWEANAARFWNWTHEPWTYEPQTFWFPGIRRGNVSYTPDFWLPAKGHFVEVKGWMDPESKTKLNRMARYHPTVKIVLLDAAFFRAIERQRLCKVIPGWECVHTTPTGGA